MIERVVKQIPLFESLGIFTEAPKKKRNVEVITARPLKQDYTDFIDDEEIDLDDDPDDLSDYNSYLDDDGEVDPGFDPEENDNYAPEDDNTGVEDSNSNVGTGEETPTQPTETIDATGEDNEGSDPEAGGDLGGDIETPPEEAPSNEGEGEVVDATDTTNNTPAEQEGSGEEGGGETIDATGGDDPGADPEAGGDLGGDIDMDTSSDTAEAPQDGSTDEGQEYTKDDMRKFELFNKTLNLYNSIVYIIDKAGLTITDNPKFGFALKQALKKLKPIESLMKDYLLLKFQSDSYTQNSFFYETVKAYVMLLLELLEINKKTEEQK